MVEKDIWERKYRTVQRMYEQAVDGMLEKHHAEQAAKNHIISQETKQ